MTLHFARPRGLPRVVLALAFCAALAAQASPQNPDRPPWAQKQKPGSTAPSPAKADAEQDRNAIKVKVDLVSVLVSVLDEHNRPAADLPAEAFQILDEDNPQTIAVFEKETQQPLDLALMVDASLSAQLGMPSEREAAAHFIQQVLRPKDRLAVYYFDENVTQLVAFTDNVGKLQDAVKRIPAGAGTSIYDAVYLGSRTLAGQDADRRKVIILITDGGETTSRADFDTARREAVRAGALLYTVIVRSVKNENGRNTAGEHALETITDTTGGAVFYPSSSAELDRIFDLINRELRTQYRLGYYPTPRGPADTYRRIEVTVKAPPAAPAAAGPNAASDVAASVPATAAQPEYSVRHRKSYYTGAQ
ncbi:MAG TPA: VWA domain-containing protein [Dongiaceae bacterium]|nr:VWA domain-containing protein [Dongiaceae bacterium]